MSTFGILLIISSYIFIASVVGSAFWIVLKKKIVRHSIYDWQSISILSGVFWPLALLVWLGYFVGYFGAIAIIKASGRRI